MRNILILTMSSAVLCSANIFAADPVAIKPAPGSLGFGTESYIQKIIKFVPLTPDQQNSMMKIIEARDKSLQELRAKNADKSLAVKQAILAAYKSQDKEAIAKARKEYEALHAGSTEIYAKARKELDGVLTSEQRAKYQEGRVTSVMKFAFDGMTLTPEQKKEIKAIAFAESSGVNSGSGVDYQEDLAVHQAVQSVLTAEQKATIAKKRTLSITKTRFGRANLTGEQIKQIESAYDDLAKSGSIKPEEIYKKLTDAVNNLLTPEQKKANKAQQKEGAEGAPQVLQVKPLK
ncbi:MAG: Spy/CpxP family protein refolding chaperone [Verrucomicrobiota bacterium]